MSGVAPTQGSPAVPNTAYAGPEQYQNLFKSVPAGGGKGSSGDVTFKPIVDQMVLPYAPSFQQGGINQ